MIVKLKALAIGEHVQPGTDIHCESATRNVRRLLAGRSTVEACLQYRVWCF